MKKRILPNRKIVNYILEIDQIKKNPDTNIDLTIKRIKKEARYTFYLVVFFLIFFLIFGYYLFSKIPYSKFNNEYISGNIKIKYDVDKNGVRNYIYLNNNKKEDNYNFTISNMGSKKTKFIVYLVDDTEIIKLENAFSKIVDYNFLDYSINNNDFLNIKKSKKKKKYIIIEDVLKSKGKKDYNLKIKINNNISNKDYYGIIMIKELKE